MISGSQQMLQIDGCPSILIICGTIKSRENTLQIVILVVGFLRLVMNFI